MWMFGGSESDRLEAQAVEECQRAEWIDVRGRGLAAFAWRDHVRAIGLPVGLALALLDTLAGGTHGDYALARLLAEDWLLLALSMAAAHVSALVEWRHRERIHNERYGRRRPTERPDSRT